MNRTGTWARRFLVAALALALIPACGYHTAIRSRAQGEPRALFVPVFENRTPESGLGVFLADAFLTEMVKNRLFFEAGPGDAEMVLSGTVTGIQDFSLSRQVGGESTQRRVYITLDVTLKDSKGAVREAFPNVTDFENYTVYLGNEPATRAERKAAVERLSGRLARKVRQDVTVRLEGF